MLGTLFQRALQNPEDTAFIDDAGAISYGSLALQAAHVAETLNSEETIVGIMAKNSIKWVTSYLGAMIANKTIVPLPLFFSDQQINHIIKDSGINTIIGDDPDRVSGISEHLHMQMISEQSADHLPNVYKDTWRLIIYTSGTTGTPKGVRLGSVQVSTSVNALASTIAPQRDDRYLSILPFSLLLEQITGIFLPIHAGVTSYIASEASTAAVKGDISPLVTAADTIRPTITVMVPEVLDGWVAALEHLKLKAPESLRFAAVGGAPVSELLVKKAHEVGIPAFEGYGLSECCSVVAVNTPEANRIGSVGRPLPGVSVSIENDEIIVDGPNVMTGYLGLSDTNGKWHTGDRGFIDKEGFVHVQGRCDNILVTPLGRNVSPEWIEGLLIKDSRISRCIIIGQERSSLGAIIVPTDAGKTWFDNSKPSDVNQLIKGLCAEAPDYARPQWFAISNETLLREEGLISDDGNIVRHKINAQAEKFIAA